MSLDNPLTASADPAEGRGWSLRAATPRDAEALALVGRDTFLDTYAGHLPGADIVLHCAHRHAPALYAGWVADAGHGVWIVEAPGGAPIGYQVMAPPDMDGFATRPGDVELKRIYLLGRHHGGGAGRAMMAAGIAWAKARGAGRVLVALWEDNHRAMAFYRRQGFVQAGTRSFTVGTQTYLDPVLALDLGA